MSFRLQSARHGSVIWMPLALLLCVSCEQQGDPTPAPPRSDLPVTNPASFAPNALQLLVDGSGQLREGSLQLDDGGRIGLFYLAGLWAGCDRGDQPAANIAWAGSWPSTNFACDWPPDSSGVVTLLPGETDPQAWNWPFEQDFPRAGAGVPWLPGDALSWCAQTSDSITLPLLAAPCRELRFSQLLWGFRQPELASTLFLRYTIRNQSVHDEPSLLVGFYLDTDLVGPGNSTGYDATRGVSYTYNPSDTGETFVCGITFLEVNGVSDPGMLVSSHRIMRKNGQLDPDFGEIGFERPEQILLALRGLSNSGLPMINPVSGQPDLFAFSGDPVARTGWLDSQLDVRSLLNGPGLSLAAGESVTLTLAFSVVRAGSLAEALERLRARFDGIRTDPGLWR